MKRVYHPPTTVRHRFAVISCAVGITLMVFLILPLTQIFTEKQSTSGDVPARVDLSEPPPPPPPPEVPSSPPGEPEEVFEEIPPVPQPEVSPIEFHQLELALDPGAGDALRGDFHFEFNLRTDTIAAFDAFEVSELDRVPSAISRPPPVYPYSMRRNRISGSVTLLFVIDETGRVRDARVEDSTHRGFERPALDAVRQWRFEPGIKDGDPVPTLVRTPIEFRLD